MVNPTYRAEKHTRHDTALDVIPHHGSDAINSSQSNLLTVTAQQASVSIHLPLWQQRIRQTLEVKPAGKIDNKRSDDLSYQTRKAAVSRATHFMKRLKSVKHASQHAHNSKVLGGPAIFEQSTI